MYYFRIFLFIAGLAPNRYDYMRFPVRLCFFYGSLRWSGAVWQSELVQLESGWPLPGKTWKNLDFKFLIKKHGNPANFLKNLKNVKFGLENSTKMNFNIFGYVSCHKKFILACII